MADATMRNAHPQQSSRPAVRNLWFAFTPYIAVAAVHLGAKLADSAAVDTWTKPLLMPALLLALLLATPQRLSRATLLASAGIVLSWLGDITLGNFVVGLTFFLLAHIAYIVLFAQAFRGRVAKWTPVYFVWFGLLVWMLLPHLGALLVPVIAYGLVLAAMATVATRGGALLALGGGLFVLSDSVLAIHMFYPDPVVPQASFVIMLTYTAAQGLIALAVLRSQRR
ncbi:lysoplasmalogenase [Lysinibacter cavernae]|uniref:Putative membrane protein YhhN n=1 Tax=Lysinibacter cavernae TaxID=1640652 RepID=A0A7X5TSM9_9MICO|nr:lysoplasmalogenase [Lysinibacter cavernae]NIH53215.1 putative membrane protein YhhN [Lysinibacter cavernae]